MYGVEVLFVGYYVYVAAVHAWFVLLLWVLWFMPLKVRPGLCHELTKALNQNGTRGT